MELDDLLDEEILQEGMRLNDLLKEDTDNTSVEESAKFQRRSLENGDSESDTEGGKQTSIEVGEIKIPLTCNAFTLILPTDFKGPDVTSNDLDEVEEIQREEPRFPKDECRSQVTIQEATNEGPKRVIFDKPAEVMTKNIKPLYIKAHFKGRPKSRVLIDNGSAVNIMPFKMLHHLGKTTEDLISTEISVSAFTRELTKTIGVLPVEVTVGSKTSLCAFFMVNSSSSYQSLLGRDWIHANWCVPSSLHQFLLFWKGNEVEVVWADTKHFTTATNIVEARYYDSCVGPIKFTGRNIKGQPKENKPLEIHEEKSMIKLTSGEFAAAASAILRERMQYIMEWIMEENNSAEVLDAEVTYVSKNLEEDLKTKLNVLLQEYKDGFAWQYSDMPGLSKTLVEHRLPINPEFQPCRQPPRRVSKQVKLKVKKDIEKLCKAGLIRPAKYSNWLANVVPVVKKNGKLRICIDFRDINEVTPKDIYVTPIADTLIDATANHSFLSFMYCFARYNQIIVAKDDISKTAFRCPGAIETFEWVVMPFGLHNASAAYQRAMNAIFNDLLGKTMEVYIDDVVVKSKLVKDHLKNLEEAFRRMRVHCLKLNPLKCAFGVNVGIFLGFLVHERGIEVDQNKTKAIREAKPPRNKTQLQRVLPLRLYISDAEGSIGYLLAQSNQDGHELAIKYLSRSMTSTEVRYYPIMVLCLALFFACTKLRHYLLSNRVYVVSQTDLMKYMLNKPVLSGNIGKWLLSLADFHLIYHPLKSVKGQALADFLADHPCINLGDESIFDLPVFMNEPWMLKFDGSSIDRSAGAGIVIVSPSRAKTSLSFNLDFEYTNNQSEYEALIIGFEILLDLGAKNVKIIGDFQLVIRQVSGEYKCMSYSLTYYYAIARQLTEIFEEVELVHVPREENWEADELSQLASGLHLSEELTHRLVMDWRRDIKKFLDNPSKKMMYKVRVRDVNYVLIEDVLYRRGFDNLLLRFLGTTEVLEVMKQTHEGTC
ncbi:uncharacterized protein LOC126670652 [Mercurialis annua]|uniref:uncharacterized protein LOC126670652 n=1 Tax=Mercurialis annua TaxID=3986 RepID=UPI00215EA240|nr:uncharacterized protein LOC126670652 [Mercurialis annua]